MKVNERRIEPVTAFSPQGIRTAEYIQLYNFHQYNFDGQDSALVNYELVFYVPEVQEDPEAEPKLARGVVFSGTIGIPDDVVQSWGADDEPIFDYVIETLGLVKFVE